MQHSYVVTGGARGVGPAVVERLAGERGTALVVVVDREAGPAHPGTITVTGDAADEAVAEQAAARAEQAAPLRGWVNIAAGCATAGSDGRTRSRRSSPTCSRTRRAS